MENSVVVLLLQTPLPFQLRSAHFSPAEEWYSEADTKAVRSLNILMINVYLTCVAFMIEYCITVNLFKFMNTNSRVLMENCIFVDY